jgi:hypothetical protein
MAKSRQYSICLPLQLAGEVTQHAELWALPFSALVRLAVEDLMRHPDRLPLLVAAQRGPMVDTTTPEQRQRAEAYLKSLEQVDLGILLGGMTTGPVAEGDICRAATANHAPPFMTARAPTGTT